MNYDSNFQAEHILSRQSSVMISGYDIYKAPIAQNLLLSCQHKAVLLLLAAFGCTSCSIQSHFIKHISVA